MDRNVGEWKSSRMGNSIIMSQSLCLTMHGYSPMLCKLAGWDGHIPFVYITKCSLKDRMHSCYNVTMARERTD